MDNELANMILEHGVELFPYLKLRAEYVLRGKNGIVEVLPEDYIFEELEMLCDSDFIKTEYRLGDTYVKVTLREDGRWLADPPEIIKFTRKEREEFIPKDLQTLGKLVGYPSDWAENPGKYRKLFFSLTKKHEMGIIISVAEYMKASKPEWTLVNLLTNSYFNQIQSELEKSEVDETDLRYAPRANKIYKEETW